jgi:hypothetical protein
MVHDSSFKVQGKGFIVEGAGLIIRLIWVFKFRAHGLTLRVHGLQLSSCSGISDLPRERSSGRPTLSTWRV